MYMYYFAVYKLLTECSEGDFKDDKNGDLKSIFDRMPKRISDKVIIWPWDFFRSE